MRSLLIRNCLIALLLFVLYEGFNFLPDNMVVIPGVFRISDAFFIFLPILFVAILVYFRTLKRFGEESLLVLAICALMLLSPLMAQIFFDQPYMKGLVLVRQNFFWLSFFVYILLLRDIDGVEKAINLLTALVGIYVLALVLTKFFPKLGLIHYDSKFYNKSGSLIRFGDYRLFFPYSSVPIYFYCITLARLLHPRIGETRLRKAFWLAFVLIVFYAILSTYTRILVSSLLIVTVFALITSKQRMFQWTAAALTLAFVSSLVLSKAFFDGEIPIIGETKLARMVLKVDTLQREQGREFQMDMYVNQFKRSPFTGVGNISTRKDTEEEIGTLTTFRKYGFFNGSDLGYMKVIGESGLAGLAWILWFFAYFFRRSRQTLVKATLLGTVPTAQTIARGHLYFFIYLIFTGVTLPHFVLPQGIAIVALSLAVLAVIRVSVNEAATAEVPSAQFPMYL